jgi:protein-disulfide isomerase
MEDNLEKKKEEKEIEEKKEDFGSDEKDTLKEKNEEKEEVKEEKKEEEKEFRPDIKDFEEEEDVIKVRRPNFWKISTFLLLVLFGISLFTNGFGGLKSVSGNVVAEDAVSFINDNLLRGKATATLEKVEEQSGIYKATINVQGQTTDVYLTKDGNYMFLQAIPLNDDTLFKNIPSQEQPDVDMVALADDDPVKGDPNAPITIIEFSDFQCPFCGKFYRETLPQIKEKYIDTGKVKLIYRDFPLSFHENAQSAAEAAECANEQGKFWEYHDLLFEKQQDLSVENYKQWAEELGLDMEQFNECLDSGKYADEVTNDFSDGQAAGVTGTPAFFINGKKVSGAQPFSVFEQIIEEELSNLENETPTDESNE